MTKFKEELELLLVYMHEMQNSSYLDSMKKEWSDWACDDARGRSIAYGDCGNKLRLILDIEEEDNEEYWNVEGD